LIFQVPLRPKGEALPPPDTTITSQRNQLDTLGFARFFRDDDLIAAIAIEIIGNQWHFSDAIR